jgi:hypothetical protein
VLVDSFPGDGGDVDYVPSPNRGEVPIEETFKPKILSVINLSLKLAALLFMGRHILLQVPAVVAVESVNCAVLRIKAVSYKLSFQVYC